MLFLSELALGLFLLILGLGICLIIYARWNYGVLESLGIPIVKPHFFLGSNYNAYKIVQHLEDIKRRRKLGPVYGVYDGRTPQVHLSDPELIRLICIKDSDHFDKRSFETGNHMMDEALELLKTDEKWKVVRSHLTPILTTGKLKHMGDIMKELSDEYVGALLSIVKSTSDGSRTKINFGEFLPPFAIEMIGKILCGIQFENARDPNNEFIKGMRVAMFEGMSFDWTFNWIQVFPFLMKLLPNQLQNGMELFEKTINGVLDGRESSGLKKPDMVGKLLELRQKCGSPEFQKLGITNNTVLGQALEFFLASYLGIITELNFLSYQLAINPIVQEKVLAEVDANLAKHDGKIDHETVAEMPYLTACLTETFRIQSAFFRLERTCLKDWEHDGVKIKKGLTVVFPAYAVHYNPELYPEPEMFKPERFLGENQHNYPLVTFGQGPRACVGQRFIYEMMKIFLVRLFKDFKIQQREDTVLKVYPGNHVNVQHDPIYVDLVKRG